VTWAAHQDGDGQLASQPPDDRGHERTPT
jgi:hypothetical protein